MTVRADSLKLEPGDLVELYELVLTPITGTSGLSDFYYFHDGLKTDNSPVIWKTKSYVGWPIKSDGWEKATRGSLPRPTLDLGNVNGAISALCDAHQDLIGAKLIRHRTYAKYLDGMPGADPNQAFPDEVYYVERKVNEDLAQVSFELASALDLEGLQLPSRIVTQNYCQWDYRSSECSYVGSSYFNVLDLPVATLGEDVCSKSVNGCKVRFGASAVLPFGGFPAARAYKV